MILKIQKSFVYSVCTFMPNLKEAIVHIVQNQASSMRTIEQIYLKLSLSLGCYLILIMALLCLRSIYMVVSSCLAYLPLYGVRFPYYLILWFIYKVGCNSPWLSLKGQNKMCRVFQVLWLRYFAWYYYLCRSSLC